MMHILDLIVENGTDASETLAPPGVGGNITEPAEVRRAIGGRVALIGGLDQHHILTHGTLAEIRAEVRRLFEGFGPDGGYIMSASDHFFETPVENLQAYAAAARECRYSSWGALQYQRDPGELRQSHLLCTFLLLALVLG